MDPERRRLVEELFDKILDRPRSQRYEALEDACGGDLSLKEEVLKLLAAHDREDGLLERPAVAGEALRSLRGGAPEGGRVGRYRILREIGKGGMGMVYLAERDDGHFRQRVALKAIHRSDPELHVRVVAERQILASLEHPNIGRLLDGGVTEDGRPFLVMEYVNGLPIDVYCDRMRLTLRERLALFLTVLKAVEHAHQNLVVHRDLKPSNILVTPSGEVKLLDFGIAKLLNPNLGGGKVPVTRAEDRVLTPEYASPEQIRGEVVTTSADVYSLGVVLYELLTGYRPYHLPDRALPKLLEAVCDKDPPPPSEKVKQAETVDLPDGSRRTTLPEEEAESRHTTSHRLRRHLRGDLDAIVMKALRKEPGRRYGSVELLSQDIEHFLAGLPVGARRGTRWYRVQKLVRRHRAEAVAAGVVMLSLMAGAGTAAWQAGVAARERDRATEALRESEEVTDFLVTLFRASDPTEVPGTTLTAVDLLERGVTRIGDLEAEPLVQARLLRVMARAHQNLGRYEDAAGLSGRAVDLLRKQYGDLHPTVASAMVDAAVALRNGGLYDSARVVLEGAQEIQERALGPRSLELSQTLEDQARVAVYLGDLAGAEARARASASIREEVLGRGDSATLNIHSTLASILRFQGRYAEAEEGFREVLDRRRRLAPVDPMRLSGDMLQVAEVLRNHRGDLEGAEQLIREAMELQEGRPGGRAPNRSWALGSLAAVMEARGDLVEAERLMREVLEDRRHTYGDVHPTTSGAMGQVAGFLARAGRVEEAEALLREAVEVDLRTVGPDHTRHAGTLTGLAEVLAVRGHLEEADSLASRAVEIRKRAQGSTAPIVAQTLSILAGIRIQRRQYESAEALLLEALAMMGGHAPEGALPKGIQGELIRLYEIWGRVGEGPPLRRAAANGS
jgi:eukaryotic-like serine/threonine-protein kinase